MPARCRRASTSVPSLLIVAWNTQLHRWHGLPLRQSILRPTRSLPSSQAPPSLRQALPTRDLWPDTSPPARPKSINVTLANGSEKGTVTQGAAQNLVTTVFDTNNNPITGMTLAYQSTDPVDISTTSAGGAQCFLPGGRIADRGLPAADLQPRHPSR